MKTCSVCSQSEIKLIGDRSYKCPSCKTKFIGDLGDLRTEAQYRADLAGARRMARKEHDDLCQVRGGRHRRYY